MGRLSKYQDKIKFGLALSGGAARGAAHIGVLQALEDVGLRPSYLAGTSVGSLIASFYAFGVKPDEIKQIVGQMHWLDFSGLSFSRMGLLSNKEIEKILLKQLGEKNIEDAPIPLAIVATDITTGERVLLKDGELTKAVMASTAIPGIFVPVEHKGRMLVDGVLVENVPVTHLKEMGADLIVGSDLRGGVDYSKPSNIVDVILNAFDIVVDTKTDIQTQCADLIIEMDLSEFERSDHRNTQELYDEGHRSAMACMDRIEEAFEKAVPTPFNILEKTLREWLQS